MRESFRGGFALAFALLDADGAASEVAYITTSAATMLKITTKNADSPRKVHAIVELANHPTLGAAQRSAIAG